MQVRFGILGPVRIWHGDTERDAGARQQRLILGLLLARSGAVVSQYELVDAVWGSEPPPSATNVLHRSIGLLRRTMEPGLPTRATGSLLTRVGTGYRLTVRPATLDLLAFRDLVTQARRHPDKHTALERYLHALSLWRGVCASGLEPAGRPCPVFTSIDGERSQATRDAADLALTIGEVSRVLPALRSAALPHPLDEALQSRHVRALAADGQRAQALAVYRTVRVRLAEELGIDPGAELRAAHDALTRATTGPRPGAYRSRPAQLPSDHPFFAAPPPVVDRALEIIERQRRAGPAVLNINGMPGIGKTTLAIHVAHRLAAASPDGQLYADLRGVDPTAVVRPTEALRGFLTSLGELPRTLPGDVAALARRYRAVLAGRRVLLVLDNCDDPDLIRELLPGTPGSVVIVTSRSGSGTGDKTLRLDLPDSDEARDLLALRLGATRTAAEPGPVQQIIAACGHLPLALAMVAARAAANPHTPLATIAGELRDGPGRTAGFWSDDAGLAAAFSWSYQRLTPAAARVFRLLPLHPGPDMTTASIAALAGVTAPEARLVVGDLMSHALLELRTGRLHLHQLLRAYARVLSAEDGAGADHRAVDRVVGYYVATAAAAYRCSGLLVTAQPPLSPPGATPAVFTGRDDAVAWLAAERPTLIDIALTADRHGRRRLALHLVTLLRDDPHLTDRRPGQETTGRYVRASLLHRSLGETAVALRGPARVAGPTHPSPAGADPAGAHLSVAIGDVIRDGLAAPHSVRASWEKALAFLRPGPRFSPPR
ncbi:AfsR/SARP family transcriptional regulator [Paractinoplanes hotanensis]|uniref:NB-ARC domain-containing protein n=1 Tax=Paractinoplanes hotanensis TaxID=2906497 RepID=A0ABT0Y949_9ACTN|nr:AfsR/SARP family transcriptional regulator [Actinoplanes hotanensis]MCM4082310.1 NB-ARC domain-containing protein [Actinoplanes hotanensis]